MVRVSYDQKPYRRTFMRLFGAECVPEPVAQHRLRAGDPRERSRFPGQPRIAISEAVEEAARPRRHQLLPRQRAQPRSAASDRDRPGGEAAARDGRRNAGLHLRLPRGGSNFGGIALPFVPQMLPASGSARSRWSPTAARASRAGASPSITVTPRTDTMVRMFTLGHDFIPPASHAGGLRYHGAAPLVSALLNRWSD